ncbi:MAG: OmpA family protein [Bacteroidia bacterium]
MLHSRNLVLFFFLLCSHIGAQDTTVTVYFKSGQSQLSTAQQASIDRLKHTPYKRISFEGYADSIGKAVMNRKLSAKRAETTAHTFPAEKKVVIGMGVAPGHNVSLNKMRKVVVKVWYDKPTKPFVDKVIEAEKKPVKIPDPCKEDTTLEYPSGVMIKMNKCYFLKIRHCFQYRDYMDPKSIQEAGLTTVDENNKPIVSGGMLYISFCKDTCMKKPIISFVPIPPCATNRQMTMWTRNAKNRWVNSKNKLEIVKINGKEYFRLEIYCTGWLNCDVKKPTTRKVKVKLKNGLKFQSAVISGNCPLYSLNGNISKNKKKATFDYICPQTDPLLYIKAINKHGDTLVIRNQNINQYTRKRRLSSPCNCRIKEKERFLVVFHIRQKYLYRKYKLYRKDFP